MALAFALEPLVVNFLIFVGAFTMLSLRSRRLAITACTLAMMNCGSLCCVLGIPSGIRGLIALNKRVVKAAMQPPA